MTTTATATRNGSLSGTLAAGDRRHSSFEPKTAAEPHSTTPTSSRQGSTSSQRRGSDSPAWLTAIQERDSAPGAGTEPRKSSVVGEIKGLFGRRKSKDATPKPKQVITSKHTSVVRNILRADPRSHPSRRHSTGSSALEKAQTEGLVRSVAHISAKELEERHPHSGPPVLHGSALTTIVSRAEDPPEQQSIHSVMRSQENLIHQSVAEGPSGEDSVPSDSGRPRKKSVSDVEFNPVPRAKKKSVFGGWHRNESGRWTR